MPERFTRQFHPAMLPALLMMTQRGTEMEKSLDDLIGFIQSTKNAMEALRNGVETFHSGLMKMVPPETPQWQPSAEPAPSSESKKTIAPLPAEESDDVFQEPLMTTTPINEQKTDITE